MKLENTLESNLRMIMMSTEMALSAVRCGRFDMAKTQLQDIQFYSYALLSELDSKPRGKLINFNGLPLRVIRQDDGSLFVFAKDGTELTDLLMSQTLDRIEATYNTTHA